MAFADHGRWQIGIKRLIARENQNRIDLETAIIWSKSTDDNVLPIKRPFSLLDIDSAEACAHREKRQKREKEEEQKNIQLQKEEGWKEYAEYMKRGNEVLAMQPQLIYSEKKVALEKWLHVCVMKHQNDRLYEILHYGDRGVDVDGNYRWIYERSLLHSACCANNFNALWILLEYGIDPDLPDEYGDTCMDIAVTQNQPDAIEILEYFAEVNASNTLVACDYSLWKFWVSIDKQWRTEFQCLFTKEKQDLIVTLHMMSKVNFVNITNDDIEYFAIYDASFPWAELPVELLWEVINCSIK